MKYIICFLIASVVLHGCNSHSDKKNIDWSGKESSLTAEVMKTDSLKGVFMPLVQGDLLITSQLRGDGIVLYRITDDSICFLNSFLAQGHGPNEMFFAWASPLDTSNELMVLDYMEGKKAFRIDVSDPKESSNTRNWQKLGTPQGTVNTLSACAVDTNTFIAIGGTTSPALFTRINLQTSQLEPLNIPYPADGSNVANPTIKCYAYAGIIRKQPGGQRIVYVAEMNRFVGLYDYIGDSLQVIAMPYEQYPLYSVAADGHNIIRPGENRIGSSSIAVSHQYIYMLTSDLTYADMQQQLTDGKSSDWSYSTTIFVFDWDGNPIQKYTLDVPVKNIMIHGDDSYLYGVTDRMETTEGTTILRFKL